MESAVSEIREFRIDVTDAEIEDLKDRLRRTRWPEPEPPDTVTAQPSSVRGGESKAWGQGLPLAYAQELRDYWLEEYDWSARQAYFNRFPQGVTEIDGLDIHFIHARSGNPDAVPLLITHGWPGSVVEFHKIIEPLADPAAHGGDAADAFHVICPSLPGYGFSAKPKTTGWGVGKIGGAWDELMGRLGYERYFAQGGDWGAAVTTQIGIQNKGRCAGIHVNMPTSGPTKEARENPTERDMLAFNGGRYYNAWGAGYSKQQGTRPQTLGYGLVDSPMAQATWIIEKFWEWTDCGTHPENALTREELIDNVMFYWWNGNGASSARLYWESFARAFGDDQPKVRLPAGCSIFPKEIVPTPRSWAEQRYDNIVYWNELDRGGHFAAFEQPELFVAELRQCFRLMR